MNRNVAGIDMSPDEFKQLGKRSWVEEHKYLCFDRSKKKDQGRHCICDESKDTFIDCTPDTNPL